MSVKGYPTANGVVPTAQLIAANQIMTSQGAILADNGFKNYIVEPHDNTFSNWVTSNVSLVTVATTTTAANLPSGSFGSAIVITRVSGTTGYVYTRFTLDIANYNTVLQYLQDMIYAGTAGDYQLQIWSNTASNYGGTSTQLTLPVTNIPFSAGSTFNTNFLSPGSTAPYLELRIVATAGTIPLYLNNVIVTPGEVVQGAAISGDVSFTPIVSAGFGTITNAVGSYRRVGNWMYCTVGFKAGTVTSAAPTFTIPGGFHADSSAIPLGSRIGLGVGNISSSAAQTLFSTANVSFLVTYSEVSTTVISFCFTNSSDASNNALTGATNTATFLNNNAQIEFQFAIPIAEWAGNGTLALGQGAQVEYASNSSTADANDTTSFVYGPDGSLVPGPLTTLRSRTVRFQYPIQVTDLLILQIRSSAAGAPWVNVSSYDVTTGIQPLNYQNATSYGAGITSSVINSTDVTVSFGQYLYASGATYASAGSAWTSANIRWRVVKSTQSAPVGFGLATATAAGLVSLPDSAVMCDTGNGYGSSNTRCRRFTNSTVTGTSISYADSATLGATFTINTAGIYCLTWTDRSNATANAVMGFGINSNTTLDIDAQSSAAQMRAITTLTSTSSNYTTSITLRMTAGDIIRAQTDSGAQPNSSGNATVQFSVVLISKT